jgi:hypothetical protein
MVDLIKRGPDRTGSTYVVSSKKDQKHGRKKGETVVCSERRETGGKRGLMARQNERMDLKEERTKEGRNAG